VSRWGVISIWPSLGVSVRCAADDPVVSTFGGSVTDGGDGWDASGIGWANVQSVEVCGVVGGTSTHPPFTVVAGGCCSGELTGLERKNPAVTTPAPKMLRYFAMLRMCCTTNPSGHLCGQTKS
jgi:hypothetical protein